MLVELSDDLEEICVVDEGDCMGFFGGRVYCDIPDYIIGATSPPIDPSIPTDSPSTPSSINASAPFVASYSYSYSEDECSGTPTSIVLQQLGVCEVMGSNPTYSRSFKVVDGSLVSSFCLGSTCKCMHLLPFVKYYLLFYLQYIVTNFQ